MRKRNWTEMDNYDYFEREFRDKPSRSAHYSLDAHLNLYAGWSDRRFSDGKTVTVFGAEEKGLNYVYGDRLYEWDSDLYKRSANETSQKAKSNTARWFQEMLSVYQGKPCEVRHIFIGVNSATLASYWCVGYKS